MKQKNRKIIPEKILLQVCIDSLEDMIVLAIDKNYNYLSFNIFHKNIMLKAYGVEVRQGYNILDCISNNEDRIKAKSNYEKALNGISHITIEEFGALDRQYYETRYNPILNTKNEIIGASAFSSNVSDRKQIELALAKSEEKFRKAFITSPDSININRLSDGMYISINEGFSKITGYNEQEVIGKTSTELNIWSDSKVRAKLVNALSLEGYVNNLETKFRMKDGSIRDGMMSASIIDLDREPHILSITRDITERKLIESELKANSQNLKKELEEKRIAAIELQKVNKKLEISRQASLNLLEDIKIEIEQRKKIEEEIKILNAELEKRVKERTKQLEAANKELEAFSYSVSHDLRSPLRAIDGFSKYLQESYSKKLDAEGQRLLGLIRGNTVRMDQLISDLLALSRVNRSVHNYSAIDMDKVALSMYYEASTLEMQKKVSLIIGSIPKAYADPTYIKQVWINLISNAIKFSSGKKNPKIEIDGYTKGGYNIYSIKDNGVGFNPEYVDKLFGVFQRLHKIDEFDGNGVGLAIVKRIIHRHGGEVWAEGKEGKGAVFYFSIPLKNK